MIWITAKFIPSWTALRSLGESRVIKSSYFWILLVPVAANVILRLETPLNIIVLGENFTIHMDLPFSWKLFFYASCAFTVASLIFKLNCPISIREYKNYDDFKQKGGSYLEIYSDFAKSIYLPSHFSHEYYSMLRDDSGTHADPRVKDVWDTLQIATGANIENNYIEQIKADPKTPQLPVFFTQTPPVEDRVSDVFFHIRSRVASVKLPARLAASSFYTIGIILMTIVSSQNIYYVVRLGI